MFLLQTSTWNEYLKVNLVHSKLIENQSNICEFTLQLALLNSNNRPSQKHEKPTRGKLSFENMMHKILYKIWRIKIPSMGKKILSMDKKILSMDKVFIYQILSMDKITLSMGKITLSMGKITLSMDKITLSMDKKYR